MRQLGVQPALEEDLHAAGVDDLLQLLAELLAREHVALGMPDGPIERAEAAARRADVRVVDVAIDDVRDDALRMLAAAHRVRREAELEEAAFAEEALALGGREALAVGRTREDRVERRARARLLGLVEARGRSRQEPGLRRLGPEALEPAELLVAEVVADRLREVCTK